MLAVWLGAAVGVGGGLKGCGPSVVAWATLCGCVRRCPTLPHPHECSTIGAVGLSFRVRNGTGRFPHAMTAVTLSISHRGGVGWKGHWIVSVTRNTIQIPCGETGWWCCLFSCVGSLNKRWWVCCLGTAWWTRSTVFFDPHPVKGVVCGQVVGLLVPVSFTGR